MRLAFVSHALESENKVARLGIRFANGEYVAEVDLKWERTEDGKKWQRPNIVVIASPADVDQCALLLSKLHELMTEDRDETDPVSWRKPADVIKVIMEAKGIHAVYDERVEKFIDAAKLTRNDGEEEKHYAAIIGDKDFTATSTTEKGAQAAICKQAMEASAESDEVAAGLGLWIRKGKAVKTLVVEGEPPKVVPIATYLDDPNGKIEIKHKSTRKSGEHAVVK